MQFHIENMECNGCARSVTKAVENVDPSAQVEIDLPQRNVTITSTQPETAFEAALSEAGFPAQKLS